VSAFDGDDIFVVVNNPHVTAFDVVLSVEDLLEVFERVNLVFVVSFCSPSVVSVVYEVDDVSVEDCAG